MDTVGMPACNVLAVRGTADAKTEAAVYEVGLEEVWALGVRGGVKSGLSVAAIYMVPSPENRNMPEQHLDGSPVYAARCLSSSTVSGAESPTPPQLRSCSSDTTLPPNVPTQMAVYASGTTLTPFRAHSDGCAAAYVSETTLTPFRAHSDGCAAAYAHGRLIASARPRRRDARLRPHAHRDGC